MPPKDTPADKAQRARVEKLANIAQRRRNRPARVKAFGPAILWILSAISLAALGAFAAFPVALNAVAGLAVLVIGGILIARGVARYQKPEPDAGRKAVDAMMEGAPASTLRDRPARLDANSAALWRAHKARLAREAAKMPAPKAGAAWAAVDPWRLRYVAPAAAGACLIATGQQGLNRIADAATPDIGAIFGAHLIAAEAWVAPPSYTGKAPFDLVSGTTGLSPAGSELTIRIVSPGAPKLKVSDGGATRTEKLTRGPDGVFEARITLDEALDAQVHWWGERAQFNLTSLPDAPPTAAFIESPTVDENDRTTFEWRATDDYGVAALGLSLRLEEAHPGAPDEELVVEMDVPGVEPRETQDLSALDLTRHPWAGLRVVARLKAVDAAGQAGFSEEAVFKLPEKLFLQPLAQAAAEVRSVVLREPRAYDAPAADDGFADTNAANPFADVEAARLERAPPDVRRAAIMLDALTYQPERYFRDPALYLGLRQARGVLSTARTKPEATTSEDVLWSVALRAEYGDLADAAAALQAAKEALENALRDGASDDEIRRLMKAFRQAVENYLAAQLAEAQRTGRVGEPGEDNANLLQGEDLQDMLDALEDLAETGAADQARQLLSDMTDLLERMRNFQVTQGGSGAGPSMDNEMSDEMQDLSDALRDQRELNDDTFAEQRRQQGRAGEQNRPGGPSQEGEDGESGAGESSGSTPGETLADRQEELRRRLEEAFAENGEGGRGGEEAEDGQGPGGSESGEDGRGGDQGSLADRLAEAQDAQRRAEDALRRGDLAGAGAAQREAADALRDAATDLAETADRLNNSDSAEGGGRDPLGRNTGGADAGYGDEIIVPDEAERQRAKDILDELRRRSGDPSAQEEELEYLRRLLRRF